MFTDRQQGVREVDEEMEEALENAAIRRVHRNLAIGRISR